MGFQFIFNMRGRKTFLFYSLFFPTKCTKMYWVESWPCKAECDKQCYHFKPSQFARKVFSCLYMGLIVVRVNIKNETDEENKGSL